MSMRLALPLGLILAGCLLQGCTPPVKTGAGAGAKTAPDQVKAAPEQVKTATDHASKESEWDDQKIAAKAVDRIYEQLKVLMHVNVTSFKRNVLISGEVPDETAKATIERIVTGIDGVRNVYNELVVSPNSSLSSRASDSLISSNVKMRFAPDKRFYASDIKVVTENGTVFLMGRLRRAEGEAAAEVASTTSWVRRVVKLFDYID